MLNRQREGVHQQDDLLHHAARDDPVASTQLLITNHVQDRDQRDHGQSEVPITEGQDSRPFILNSIHKVIVGLGQYQLLGAAEMMPEKAERVIE